MARKRVNFWLDQRKREDVELEQLIDGLKQDRLFSRAIREGLRLWVDSQTTDTLPPPKSDSGAGQLDEIKSLLEMLVAQSKSNGGLMMHQSSAPTGKLIAAPVIAPPSFADDDDDAPLLILCKDTHIDTSWNFIHSLGGIR